MQSIRWKLVLTYLIITALTMGVIGVYITGSMKDYILEQKKINTLAQTNRIAGYISQYQDYSTRAINKLLKEEQISSDCRVFMLDAEGCVTYDSNDDTMKGKYMFISPVFDAIEGNNSVEEGQDGDGELIISAAVPIMKDKTVTGVIYYQALASDVSDFIDQINVTLIMLVAFVSILICIVSFIMSGIITHPIRDITEKLSKAADEEEDYVIIEKTTGGEMGQLIDSFNKMTEQIQKQEEKRQE